MKFLEKLHSSNKTCLIYDRDTLVFESVKRGVQPLIDFISFNDDIDKEYILVDKIIGRGAVILAKLIGVTEIHTPIISQDALELALEYNILPSNVHREVDCRKHVIFMFPLLSPLL